MMKNIHTPCISHILHAIFMRGIIPVLNASACVYCHRMHSGFVCESCSRLLIARQAPFCAHCGTRLVSEQKYCVRCRLQLESPIMSDETSSHPSILAQSNSLWSYNEYSKLLVQQYKKSGGRLLSYYFAETYQRMFSSYIEPHATIILVPMPSNPKHSRQTGFDHMRRIAYAIKRRYHIVVCPCIGRKESKEQKVLRAEARKDNMQKSLFIISKQLKKLHALCAKNEHCHILLLDDIITTGSTIQRAYELIVDALSAPVNFTREKNIKDLSSRQSIVSFADTASNMPQISAMSLIRVEY